jgi:SAM-dependent methyltransferase
MASLQVALAKAKWSLIHRGVWGTLGVAAKRANPWHRERNQQFVHPFDTQYGVDTSGLISAVRLAAGHAHDLYGTAYAGIPPSRFRYVIQKWAAWPPELPVEEYTFIDIGCGKGRAVLLATELPFREVIGVELSPDLAKAADKNVEIWKAAGRGVAPARVVCQDGTEFVYPETPCVIYLSNPFAEPVVKVLLEQIERSFSAKPRPLDIIYFTPKAGHLFAEHPKYTELWSEVIEMSPEDAAVELVCAVRDTCTGYRRTGQGAAN